MVLSGAGTLGFINLGLRFAVAASEPVAEIYAGSIIEFGLLATASTLGLLTYTAPDYTFTFFAVPAALVTVFLFGCARFDAPQAVGAERSAGLLEGASQQYAVASPGAVVVEPKVTD